MAIDRIDVEILAALQNNARLTNKELAAKVGLSQSSCLDRVRRLAGTGVLKGYHADVAVSALNIQLEALIAIRLARHSKKIFRALHRYLLSLPEVLSVFHVSGINDLQVHVAVPHIRHLRDFIVDRLATRREVSYYETSVIFDSHKKHRLPNYVSLAR